MTARLLAGGIGYEMGRHFPNPGDPVGATRMMLEEPALVHDLHEGYLEAGAEIITTNTGAANHRLLNRHGLGDRFAEANRIACEAAVTARDSVNPAALIAGVLPPISQSDDPNDLPPLGLMEAEYAELALMLAPQVDLFICESMWSAAQAFAAARAARAAGRPVWVAFTLRDAGEPVLRGGERIADAATLLQDIAVDALLLSCTTPEMVTLGLPELIRAADGVEVGAYANAYRDVPGEWQAGKNLEALMIREDIDAEAYAAYAEHWLDEGATIIGGCCEVGPAYLARLKLLIEGR
ncbi:homocysteine S-methyltransferase family protein [Acuticoccus sp. M5D2P5]|uniref:homocysteine S-methyltransferase family protein n=1 Tax=Acuticoccus kalidii TaxID=2910977 RepID=UPI001F2432EF|nr:homocysteine S-methyltransferase family protein [Acuticoccus kalidii]MCF3934173.1 homocysteine S-methyltransferase family protein [Acuticoccus kalidii]